MKIPLLLLLFVIKSLFSAKLKAEENQQTSNPEQDAAADQFIEEFNQRVAEAEREKTEKEGKQLTPAEREILIDHVLMGEKSEGALTKEECKKIETLRGNIYTNRNYYERDGEWYKISKEDEELLTKGAKYENQDAIYALKLLYEYRNETEKLEIVVQQIVNKLIKEGKYETAFWNVIHLFTNDKYPDKIRKYGWCAAKNLFVEKKLDGDFEGVEQVLPFLVDNENPVNVLDSLFYQTKSIKRPSFNVKDELLAYDLIAKRIKVWPARGLFWKGRINESGTFKNMPEAFNYYKQGAMLKEKYCIQKVVEFIQEGKGVVPSTSEELIWRYVAQALEADPNSQWGVLNKQKISLIELSLKSSYVSFEPLRISANKLVDQINKTSSETTKTNRNKETNMSIGTGFIISADGIILTACHVIKNCKKISVNQADGNLPAQVIAEDEKNDIAILKADGLSAKTYLSFSKAEPKQGDKISTFGFPHANIEGKDCKYSSGEISSLIGLGSDKRYLRLNLQVSPGNSGGPLLDASNHIIGLLTAKLDAVKMLEETGDLPTGVSYAAKNEWILRLLNTNGLSQKISFNGPTNKPAESIVLISAE